MDVRPLILKTIIYDHHYSLLGVPSKPLIREIGMVEKTVIVDSNGHFDLYTYKTGVRKININTDGLWKNAV